MLKDASTETACARNLKRWFGRSLDVRAAGVEERGKGRRSATTTNGTRLPARLTNPTISLSPPCNSMGKKRQRGSPRPLKACSRWGRPHANHHTRELSFSGTGTATATAAGPVTKGEKPVSNKQEDAEKTESAKTQSDLYRHSTTKNTNNHSKARHALGRPAGRGHLEKNLPVPPVLHAVRRHPPRRPEVRTPQTLQHSAGMPPAVLLGGAPLGAVSAADDSGGSRAAPGWFLGGGVPSDDTRPRRFLLLRRSC